MKRTTGFSLVEVMLATALLAAGLALAFTALRNATQATTAAGEGARRAERLRAVQAFMRRQLEGAMALPVEAPAPGQDLVVFEASDERLRFVAPMPGYLSQGGPHVNTFELVRGAGGLRLEFRHELLAPEGPVESDRPPEVLLEGLAEAAFDVRALGPDGLPQPWQSDWENTAEVPRLVRLRARFAEPRARWPDLVVAPRVGQTALAVLPLPTAPPDDDGGER